MINSSIINQDYAPTDLPTGDLMETLSLLRFLFPDNSSLRQVDEKLTRTATQNVPLCLPCSYQTIKAMSSQMAPFPQEFYAGGKKS